MLLARCLWLALLLAASAGAAPIQVKDDRGQELRLARPAQRVIALAPHLTELVFQVGAGASLVGVSSYSDYPAAAAELPIVGHSGRADAERVVSLRPDLILAWDSGNSRSDVERLEALGIPVFVLEVRRLDEIAAALIRIGRLTGHEPQAQREAAQFRRALQDLRERYRERVPVRVFIEISARPLMTLNGRHLVSDALRLCRGENVFTASTRTLPQMAVQVGVEDVLRANPDVLLISDGLSNVDEELARWRGLKTLDAARHGHIYTVPAALMFRATPRVLAGTQRACQHLDAVRAAARH